LNTLSQADFNLFFGGTFLEGLFFGLPLPLYVDDIGCSFITTLLMRRLSDFDAT
jgi:hypothetical protein